jgi:hypothetical protein
MLGMVELLLRWPASLAKSRRQLEGENLVLFTLARGSRFDPAQGRFPGQLLERNRYTAAAD